MLINCKDGSMGVNSCAPEGLAVPVGHCLAFFLFLLFIILSVLLSLNIFTSLWYLQTLPTKHYTENSRSSNTNVTKNPKWNMELCLLAKPSQPVDLRDFVFLWDEELDFLSIYWIPYIINDTRVLTNSVISLGLPNDPQNHLYRATRTLPKIPSGIWNCAYLLNKNTTL
jgi:hypothetical protein